MTRTEVTGGNELIFFCLKKAKTLLLLNKNFSTSNKIKLKKKCSSFGTFTCSTTIDVQENVVLCIYRVLILKKSVVCSDLRVLSSRLCVQCTHCTYTSAVVAMCDHLPEFNLIFFYLKKVVKFKF